MKKSTAGARKIASNVILGTLDDDEAADISKVDLENVILRAMVLGKKEHLVSEDLPDKIRRLGRYRNEVCYPLGSSLEDVEKNYIQGLLNSTGWNVSRAARVLRVNRMTLYNKMRRYGFRRHPRK